MSSDRSIRFTAPEYQVDGSIQPATYAFTGSATNGWAIHREGALHLRLGAGYELLRVSHCGVCSTDLARRYLPFPLPQVTGHEVVALNDAGQLVAVEINASHAGRGLDRSQWCGYCRADLDTHCPDRLVLGIHDLLGGFSPWVLAPAQNVHVVPGGITPSTATLIEPFSAALHAVRALAPRTGDRIAVLGPRRLGSLIIAALVAWRIRSGQRYEILAIARRAEMRALARSLGADDVMDAADAMTIRNVADVVVETTGSPEGLALAIQLATREVHVKSTTGKPTLGVLHLTEMVVDEISLSPFREEGLSSLPAGAPQVAAVLGDVPTSIESALRKRGVRIIRSDTAAELAATIAGDPTLPLGAADFAIVTSQAAIDAAIRPLPGIERGLVRARGTIYLSDIGQPRDGLLSAVLDKRLRVTTTRCGDFRQALALLCDPSTHLGEQLGERLVTHRLPANQLSAAFTAAAAPQSVKVLVTHPDARV